MADVLFVLFALYCFGVVAFETHKSINHMNPTKTQLAITTACMCSPLIVILAIGILL